MHGVAAALLLKRMPTLKAVALFADPNFLVPPRVLSVVRREAKARGLTAYCPAKHSGLLRDLVIRSGTSPVDGCTTLLVQIVTRRKVIDPLDLTRLSSAVAHAVAAHESDQGGAGVAALSTQFHGRRASVRARADTPGLLGVSRQQGSCNRSQRRSQQRFQRCVG